MEITLEDRERFEASHTPIPESGCWLWDSSQDDWDYGRFRLGGRQLKAHRASWLIHHGPIPAGWCVLHRCHTPGCVRPDHLYLGDAQDNADDARRHGRQVAATRAAARQPEIKAKVSAAVRAALQRPEVKAKMVDAVCAAWQRPEVRERRSAAIRAAMQRPEVKAKLAAPRPRRGSVPDP